MDMCVISNMGECPRQHLAIDNRNWTTQTENTHVKRKFQATPVEIQACYSPDELIVDKFWLLKNELINHMFPHSFSVLIAFLCVNFMKEKKHSR